MGDNDDPKSRSDDAPGDSTKRDSTHEGASRDASIESGPDAPALGAGFVDQPLIYGVEDFQIQYVLDDGTTLDDPIAGPDGITGNGDDTPANLLLIRQIKFTINVRSEILNEVGLPFKQTQTVTYSTRNLGYDAN